MEMEIETKLRSIQSTYPYRDVQTQQLFHYLNMEETNNIVVYGPRATCKTSIVAAIVEHFQMFHASVNVLHHVNTRNICESILKQIKKQLMNLVDDQQDQAGIDTFETACTNSVGFVEKLELLLKNFHDIYHSASDQLPIYKQKLVIILDNVDSLIKDNNNDEFIYLMNNIEQLTKETCSISVIYISAHSVDWLMRQCEFKPCSLQVLFNCYTHEEMLHLLSSRILPDSEFSSEFYSNYINMILKSLTPYTRNFTELQSICLRNFAHYIQPIEEEEMTYKDSGKLFLKFQPKLKQIIESLSDHKIVRLDTSIEFSPSMSYLLVAAYLASYNSVKSDKRHFVRNQGRNRERRRKKQPMNYELEAKPPKPFTFERLFNVYQALVNLNENDQSKREQLMVSSIVFQQFTELIKQNLIFAIKSSNNVASISSVSKYQLSDIVNHKHIDDIALSIRLKLNAFVECS